MSMTYKISAFLPFFKSIKNGEIIILGKNPFRVSQANPATDSFVMDEINWSDVPQSN